MTNLVSTVFAALLFAMPALAEEQQPAPPPATHEVRLIRALAMFRTGRLDQAFQAWEQLAKEGNKEAAYVLRVLAPLKPQPQ